MDIFTNISSAFHQGGIWMWAIFAAQIVSFAIIIERVIALYLRRSAHQRAIVKRFEQDIRKGDLEKVLTRAQALGQSNPISVVVQAGTQAALDMGGRDEI